VLADRNPGGCGSARPILRAAAAPAAPSEVPRSLDSGKPRALARRRAPGDIAIAGWQRLRQRYAGRRSALARAALEVVASDAA
jgi:hypothetical protein